MCTHATGVAGESGASTRSMFRVIVIVARLLLIGDYALRLGRWYQERRRLRWWQSRIVHFDASEAAVPEAAGADDIGSHPGSAGFNWLGTIFAGARPRP